ncbi:hypothetical protein DTL42_24755 [Bremerella cremea]|uniref:Uncharacterized protein n=1 Tax=Bremerella cremea TaxID=1031537 RepID=A0A368KMM1_9BACT|nr:hypothetical protein [Bremerella cremea]RCS40585.1 hypothetical protein DTL42_24755 [Bremerella cremea]
MRHAYTWAILLVTLSTGSAWAQSSGGFGTMDSGIGEVSPGGGFGAEYGGGFGYGTMGPTDYHGIHAYRENPNDGGKLQVIWTGPEAAKSQAIYERLSQEESKLRFIDTPLEEVAEYLKRLHNVSILLDLEELKKNKLDHELPITIDITDQSAQVALDLLCDRYHLGWYVEKGVLMITTQEDAERHSSVRIYKLHQLNANGVVTIVTKMVQPKSWATNDGDADIVAIADRQMLVIRQNRAAHAEIETLLKSLEAAK